MRGTVAGTPGWLATVACWIVAVAGAGPDHGTATGYIVGAAAFAALLLAPGAALERALERRGLRLHPQRLRSSRARDWRDIARDVLGAADQSPQPAGALTHDRLERRLAMPARWFVTSLGVMVPAALAGWILDAPTSTLAWWQGLVTVAAAVWGRAPGRANTVGSSEELRAFEDAQARSTPWSKLAIAVFVAVVACATAMALGADNIARDRTWYLAYITQLAGSQEWLRHGIDAAHGRLDWTEPFFATGRDVPRFAGNIWIAALATWSRLALLDPVFVFQRLAPVLLVPLTGSASIGLARTLFGRHRAAAPATAALLVSMNAAWPFFADGHALFFARLVEDKTVALLVVTPVVWTLALEWIIGAGKASAAATMLAAALAALGATHALVYAIVLTSGAAVLAALAAGAASGAVRAPGSRRRRVAAAAALALALALPPAVQGLVARATIVPDAGHSEVLQEQARHPVVRSHRRMQRLVDVDPGGPVVDPRLVGDDGVLVVALLGIAVAWRERRRIWAVWLLGTSLPCLALAFMPWVSPAFGAVVLPWMTYRILWGVPFGVLLAALVLYGPRVLAAHRASRGVGVAVLCLLVLSVSWHRLPRERLDPTRWGVSTSRVRADDELQGLLDRVAALEDGARIAATAELSELIAALVGRPVLAVSDRATAVFAESTVIARERLRANALLTALGAAPASLRAASAARFGVTHLVLEDARCPAGTTVIDRDTRFVICKLLATGGDQALEVRPARATAAADDEVLADLGDGLSCSPPPDDSHRDGVRRWIRDWRFSGRPVVVRCHGELAPDATARELRLELNLPHARESVLYAWELRAGDELHSAGCGALEFSADGPGAIELPPGAWTRFDVELTPAYLPYINIRALQVRGRRRG